MNVKFIDGYDGTNQDSRINELAELIINVKKTLNTSVNLIQSELDLIRRELSEIKTYNRINEIRRLNHQIRTHAPVRFLPEHIYRPLQIDSTDLLPSHNINEQSNPDIQNSYNDSLLD